jgi:threonylcarbamoyladenosine tRNA methylthiotransferase MtaB
VKEVRTLCQRGYTEVVLTGINIGNYRDNGVGLIILLKQLEDIDFLKRVRLSSIEPTHLDDRFLEYLSCSRKFCTHLHIPLQSGDRTTLQRMGRRYSPEAYVSLLTRLKEILPEIAIGADVIVGFPGENEEQFENTVSLIRKHPISYLHVFRYSPREETAASRFPDRVREDLKKRRCERLMSLSAQKWFSYRNSFIGHEVEVLVEHRREVNSNRLMGLSSNYIKVLLDGEDDLMGKLVTVRLEKVMGKYCCGEIVDR